MNSFERFNEEKLPARKYFFSSTKKGKIDNDVKRSDDHVSIKDYLMCEKIWDQFEMKNMGDYHDHYLKMTGIKLEKISDIDKYLLIEKGSIGGISYIAKKHAKANNKYMNNYDPEKL